MGITKTKTKLPAPNYKQCETLAENRRQKKDDVIVAEVVTEEKGSGCKVTITSNINGVNDAVVTIEKSLWLSNTDTVYTSKAAFYKNASKDEARKLDMAVDSFIIK